MWTYQVRKRTFRIEKDTSLEFPNSVELSFTFQPLQPFGSGLDRGLTAVKAIQAEAQIDPYTGRYFIESETPLQPLDVSIKDDDHWSIRVQGNNLLFKTNCETPDELQSIIESLYFGFPILLNVEFVDPPRVERVTGKVGEVPFSWELSEWKMQFETTTQENQEGKVVTSWRRFNIISLPENRRLIAALHYFHMACRLERAGTSPWEFMGEVILNLRKVLEALFPGSPEKSIDAGRKGLASLGISDKDIERCFIPAMALRN